MGNVTAENVVTRERPHGLGMRSFVVLFPRGPLAGLFFIFNQVIRWLYVCERDGRIPIVYVNNVSPYWSDAGYNGCRNVWEYYFKPVSPYSVADVIESDAAHLERSRPPEFSNAETTDYYLRNTPTEARGRIRTGPSVLVSPLSPKMPRFLKSDERRMRAAFGSLIERHIVIREEVQKKIDAFYDEKCRGHRLLGVHVRGASDKKVIVGQRKKGVLPLGYYEREIDRYIRKHPSAKIFVATDTRKMLEALKKRYGQRILHCDSLRLEESDIGRFTGLHHAAVYSGPKRGEEALTECVLLSRSDYLIHGISNMSKAALFFNPRIGHCNVYDRYAVAARTRWFLSRQEKAKTFTPFCRDVCDEVRARVRERVKGIRKTVQKDTAATFRRATSRFRLMPDFLIIGGMKCGTNSLYYNLIKHPCVGPSARKEIHYFTKNYGRGNAWYRSFFPLKAHRAVRRLKKTRYVTGEATPGYLFYGDVPERVNRELPRAKIIVLLRNPVERAFSDYREKIQRGREIRSFEEATGVHKRHPKGAAKEWPYVRRGIYVDQLRRWNAHFSRKEMLIIQSEAFFKDPERTYDRVLGFLGLPPWRPKKFDILHASGDDLSMRLDTRRALADYFRPHNERLYRWLGYRFEWDECDAA